MIKTTHNRNKWSDWRNISPRKFVKTVSFIVGAIFLVSVIIFVFFPDPFINAFVKNKISNAFTEAYPEYSLQIGDIHYSVWQNLLECDSITLKNKDSTFTCSLDSFSISGIGWIKFLMQTDFNPNNLSSSVIKAQNIVFSFHKSQEELYLGMLHISVPDSEIVFDSIKYRPLINDEQFFVKSQFRQTRVRFGVSQIKVIGLNFMSLLQGNTYTARKIYAQDLFTDILLNKDKPYDKKTPYPQMPNEILPAMKERINIDCFEISNGRLKYSERFAINTTPGIITFDKFNISVSRFANHTAQPETTIIRGNGLFMNSAEMKVFMAIPLTSKEFSIKCSGSLSKMDLSKLNVFIEPVENRQIKSGFIQSAAFNINVNSGHASGNLRVAYDNLAIAILNKNIGFDLGVFNHLSNFIGDMFIIRTTNLPDEKGLMKIGEINYKRKPTDHFFQFLWFALRSGVGDVVGF
ncbi:MAG: hypothetical protein IPJ23_10915 [Ignavibacteriales bacterium]|nr:hypothetical protein [Ignavibacteriales bacterium]